MQVAQIKCVGGSVELIRGLWLVGFKLPRLWWVLPMAVCLLPRWRVGPTSFLLLFSSVLIVCSIIMIIIFYFLWRIYADLGAGKCVSNSGRTWVFHVHYYLGWLLQLCWSASMACYCAIWGGSFFLEGDYLPVICLHGILSGGGFRWSSVHGGC